ncbi:MAG TPA: hypothetical protein VJ783_30175 [Pirellulales bacterium]|nr:hypothetical protein [Pirellulales bacterium]
MTDLTLLEAGLPSIEFRRISDRYSHQIFTGQGGQRRLLLESVEGGGDDPWPPSPPLQELHIERQADGRQVALLVGRAGRSHWSLSVEAFENRLVFDAACRLSAEAEWLGSSYRAPTGAEISNDGATFAGGLLRILSATGEGTIISDYGVVRIHAERQAATGPRTVRWQYAIEAS